MSLNLKIVTPEKEIYSGEATQVNIPSEQGELGILPHHTNLMAKLKPGELTIKQGEKLTHMAVGDGFFQVGGDALTVMTDLAIDAAYIDEKKVEEAKKRAEDAMTHTLSEEEHATTLAVLEKSLVQLRVKRKHHVR